MARKCNVTLAGALACKYVPDGVRPKLFSLAWERKRAVEKLADAVTAALDDGMTRDEAKAIIRECYGMAEAAV